MRNALAEGTMSAGHARAVLMIPDQAERQRLFARLQQFSVREAEAYAARVRARLESGDAKPGSEAQARPARSVDPYLRDLEQRLIDTLGTKVKVTGTTQRGKIEIAFFNADDLERIGLHIAG